MIAYADVSDLNENFAIQAFRARVSNENVHYTLCNDDIVGIQGLIAMA